MWKITWRQEDTDNYEELIKKNAEIRRHKVAHFQRFFHDHKRPPHRHIKIKQQMAEDLKVEFMQYRRNPNHNRTEHRWTLHNMLYKILDLGGFVTLGDRIILLDRTNSGWRKDINIWINSQEHPVHLFLSM
jgi:hypothetical protein